MIRKRFAAITVISRAEPHGSVDLVANWRGLLALVVLCMHALVRGSGSAQVTPGDGETYDLTVRRERWNKHPDPIYWWRLHS